MRGERYTDHGCRGSRVGSDEKPLLIKPSPFLPEDPNSPLRPSMPACCCSSPLGTHNSWLVSPRENW